MKEVYHATVELQKKMMSLSNCLDILDLSQGTVEDGRVPSQTFLNANSLQEEIT